MVFSLEHREDGILSKIWPGGFKRKRELNTFNNFCLIGTKIHITSNRPESNLSQDWTGLKTGCFNNQQEMKLMTLYLHVFTKPVKSESSSSRGAGVNVVIS